MLVLYFHCTIEIWNFSQWGKEGRYFWVGEFCFYSISCHAITPSWRHWRHKPKTKQNTRIPTSVPEINKAEMKMLSHFPEMPLDDDLWGSAEFWFQASSEPPDKQRHKEAACMMMPDIWSKTETAGTMAAQPRRIKWKQIRRNSEHLSILKKWCSCVHLESKTG